MVESGHNIFMKRCLEIASKAEGETYPNPLVGSVIVHEGKIIGEGYHIRAGEKHAEITAIDSVSDKSLLKDSTLYVNLEPCSHYGKTPPCADALISYGIPRVVIGTIDTSDKVSGGGIRLLQNAGCEVITGVLEKECRRINRRFFTFNEKKRPYITLKWAQSADGYLDKVREKDKNNGINWITGKPERILVHKWRATEEAILAGAGTVRTDNPILNVREWPGRQPVKLILSGSGTIDNNSSVFKSVGTKGQVVVFTYN
jgi:diaminohydroxyphosphoribosylaminopyrimidine deaminase/5-amino-6-(5-phosphoribosylamino)uracil reductase